MNVNEQKLDTEGIQDLGSNPYDLVKGDPIVYYPSDNKRIVGQVSNLYLENNVTKVDLELRDGSIHKVKANDPNLDALFMRNQETGKKTTLRFSHKEVIKLLNSNQFNGKGFDDLGKNSFNNLKLGGKSVVIDNIQITKQAKENNPAETFVKSGRYNIYESNGTLRVNLDFKNRTLNLDNKILGLELTEAQKKQLRETGELGLVEGFVNTKSGEVYKNWVSLDKELNKVVTRPENTVYIDKLYGKELSLKEQETLKKGKTILLEFKNTKGEAYKTAFQVSAASLLYNGINRYTEEFAKKNKLVTEEPATKKKSSGLKIK